MVLLPEELHPDNERRKDRNIIRNIINLFFTLYKFCTIV